MKFKIDKNGFLHIERHNGLMKKQCCPNQDCQCGDHCPLFGEPEAVHKHENNLKTKWAFLEICHKTLTGSLTDERVRG